MKSNATEKNNIQQLKDKIDILTETVSKLKKSEQLLTNAVEDASIGMVTLTIEGKFRTVNKAFRKITGYTKKELLTLNISQITHPNDIDSGNNVIEELISGKAKKANFEKRYIHKNGNTIYAQVSAVIIQDKIGTPQIFFTQVIDITEQKRVESKLKQNEKMLRQIIDTSPSSIFLKDRNGMYLMVNKRMAELHSKKPADFVGKYDYEIAKKWFETIDYNEFRKAEQDVIDNKKKLIMIEEPFVFQDGNEGWFQTTKIPFELEDNKNCLLVISTDITKRKRYEEALQESEKRLALAVEGAGLGLWDQDFSSGKIIRNERWAQMLGYELDEIEQSRSAWSALIHPDDLVSLENSIKEHEQERTSIFSVEHRLRTKDGKWKWIHNWGRVVERDKTGKPLRAIGVHLDITDRKQAEEEVEQKSMELEKQFKSSEKQRIATLSALSDLNETAKELQSEINIRMKSEEALAAVNKTLEMLGQTVHSINECVSITDKEHKIIFVNEAWEKTYGYKKEEAIGKTAKLIETEEQSDLKNEMRRQTKLGGWKGELTNKKKDGTIFPSELSITPLRDKNGIIIAQIGISTDITERKQLDNALRENQEKLQSLFLVAPIGIGVFSENIFVQVNRRICDITGYKRVELVGENMKKIFVTAKEFDRVIEKQNESIQKYGKSSIETTWKHKDGRIINIQLNATPFDKRDISQGITFTILDITHRKQAEESLIASEKRYRKFFMDDLTGDYLSTREGKIIDCNPQFLKIFGFQSLKEAQNYQAFKLYLSKSEREKFIKRLEKNKVLINEQLEQYKVSGEKIIIQENVSGEFDDDGKLINIRGYLFNITKHVKSEQEVIKLSTAVEQSPLSIIITDTDGIIEYVNSTFEKLTGYSSEEAIGSKPSMLKSGVTSDSEYRKLWETITAGKVWVGEFLNKKKNGELYWESATISPILDNNKNITHFLAVKEDITKKKAIVSELMDREEKYRTLTQNLNVGVYRSTPGKNGKFIESNPAFLKIFGFRNRNELERYKVVDFYSDPLERDRIEEKLAFKGFLMNEEVKLRKKDGSIFFASISSTSATNELGKVIHHDSIIEDITERKELMEGIVQERDRSQLYLDIAGVMFIALDWAGNIILANQKTCEIIGKPEKELIGKNWVDNYLPKDVRSNVKDVFKNLMDDNTELAEFHENEILTISGDKRLIAWHNSQIKDDAGKIVGIVSSGLDITESKEEEELRKQLYEASRNLAESLDINVVLNRLSKQARSLLKCNGVTIYMLEDDQKTLKPVVCYDPPYTKQVLVVKINIDKSFTGQAIKKKTGKIFNYHDNIKGAFHIKGTPKTDTDNLIISPLIIDGEVIGALTLVRAKIPFTDKDLNIVNTFAVYGSTAIKNANIHKQILHEIEERKQAQTLLKESHHRYESIFNGAVDGIVYSDWDGKILSVNSAFTKLIGMKKADLIEKKLILFAEGNLSGESLRKTLKFIKRALKGDAIKDYLIKIKGAELEFSTPNEKGLSGLTIMIRDVTERNKARKNIELHQKNLATLSNELTMAEEKAKRHLAITLHDKLGQSLILANFKNNELNKKVKKPEHKKIISEISDFLEDAINESRNITYELSPPVLYEMGLVPAINWKLDEIEKNNNIKTSLINRSKSYEIDKRGQIILYRSISELLQNVIKHSKADKVNVSFRLLTNDYRITVSDNGVGFDFKSIRKKVLAQKKFGLFSIMERIKYIGGRVEIDTKHRRGTKIIINMPIKNYKN